MAIVKLSAVVLKCVSFGESSVIATIFSLDHGLLKCAVRGGRKHGKSSIPIDRGITAEFTVYLKENRDVHNISDYLVIDTYEDISKSIVKATIRDFAFEIFLLMITDPNPHPNLYSLLTGFLSTVNQSLENDIYPFYLWLFMYRLLQFEGLSFVEQSCVSCGNALLGDITLNNRMGGFECPNCTSEGINRVIPHTLIEKLSGKTKEPISNEIKKKAHSITKIFVEYIRYNTGSSFKLKSADVLFTLF